jgi:DNA (cytosine-5)-methyltransferase 1
MKSVELFAGAGGLAIGTSRAGFKHDAVVERDKHACATIRENQRRGVIPAVDWPLFEGDVRDFDYSTITGGVDLLAGGPPCQPFSLGGKHRGYQDNRNLFPEAVRAVHELRPRVFMFENVKGLLRQSFAKYFEYIILQLTYPDVSRRESQDWTAHLSVLEQHHTHGRERGLHYRVVFRMLNAANFGVPQKRERVFIVGFRSDLGVDWSFPDPTHSRESLLFQQWVTGEYWDFHKISNRTRANVKSEMRPPASHLLGGILPFDKPWRTVRDAISDLPNPIEKKAEAEHINHRLIPGARIYKGHTGSSLDEPAKTLKAGDHGVPGGENMLAYPDGKVRYFTVRESARLQAFPDDYLFPGSWGENMRQLGNAVPVTLAEGVANSIRERLETCDRAKFRANTI